MPGPRIRRIDCARDDASAQLAALRAQLSPQGDVVSPRSRALTERVFGQALTPVQVVERICTDVQTSGLEAVLRYTEAFDGVRLTADTLRVTHDELAAAHREAAPAFLQTLRRVRQRITTFQTGILHRNAILSVAGSHELTMRYLPMRRVGVCIPGGAAAYPSTLLMTVVPAQAAGVKEIAVVMPPTNYGGHNPDMLAACHELGVPEVYRIGGAQAVAAMAYGVAGLQAVDMIVGPGNLFVALAKRHVFGRVLIDMLAGPTEVVLVADDSAPPEYLAADLISQAEHAPGASILISWDALVLDKVEEALIGQLERLPRGELARESLEHFGALVLTRNCQEALNLVNQLAPEHLQLLTRDADQLVGKIDNAGAVFVGLHSPVAVGDYVAGPSHVLPTGGTARFSSGLSANDFLRRSSVIKFQKAGLEKIAGDLRELAGREGLAGHAASVDIRLN